MKNSVLRFVSSAVLLAAIVGCSKQHPWEKTVPVAGTITLKGIPVKGAELTFLPQDQSFPMTVRPKAKSDDNGKFVVWTYAQGDGAPPGSYKVTAVRNEVAVSKNTIVTKPNDLPSKYSNFVSTDLVVTVSEGQGELEPIEMK